MGWYKQGDLFLSTSLTKNGSGYSMFQYDGTSFALKASYKDDAAGDPGTGSSGDRGNDGAWVTPWGHVWFLHFTRGAIECRHAATGARLWEVTTPSAGPESVVFDRIGYAYVGFQGGSRLEKYQLDGTLVAVYHPTVEGRGVEQLELHEDGHTLLYTSESNHVLTWDIRSNKQGGNFATIQDPVSESYAIRRVPLDGSYLVVVYDGDYGRVDRFSINGNFLRSYNLATRYELPFGVAVEADSLHCWVGAQFNAGNKGCGVRINLSSGTIVQEIDLGYVPRFVDGTTVNIITAKGSIMKVS